MGSFFFWVNWILFAALLVAPLAVYGCIERKRREKRGRKKCRAF